MNPLNKFIEMTNDFNKIDEIRLFLEEFNKKYNKSTGFNISLNFDIIEAEPEIISEDVAEIEAEPEIINEILEEHLEEFTDDFDIDTEIQGEVESVMLELLDTIEIETERAIEEVPVITVIKQPIIKKFNCDTCGYTAKDGYALKRHCISKKHLKRIRDAHMDAQD